MVLLTNIYYLVRTNADNEVQTLLQNESSLQLRRLKHLLLPYVPTKRGFAMTVQYFLTMGADIETREPGGQRVLHGAAREGHTDVVSLLLINGAEVNARDNRGSTALTFAAEKGNTSVVKVLLDKGADIDATDSGGNNALVLVLEWRSHHAELMKMSLEQGASSEATTAFAKAARSRREEVLEALLGKGANTTIKK